MANTKRRRSKQRQIILEELRSLKCHPTADYLYQLLRGKVPNISLGTVYRNLELLRSDDLLQKINSLNGHSRFDGNPFPHQHIHCTCCGRLDDAEELNNLSYLETIRSLNGYIIKGYKLDFVGLCAKCSRKDQTKKVEG